MAFTSTARPTSSHRHQPPPPSVPARNNGSNGNPPQPVQNSNNNNSSSTSNVSSRAPKANSRRSVTPTSRSSRSFSSSLDSDNDPGRVRVAVRLRPRIAEDVVADADFADCVELQPELKRLKLRKNNWSSESYRFDEVFTETASQKRVYEVVAKPVVEGVLDGYNGTVMAYGQTGTGKTYTVGRLGKDDTSERGIMARAVDDIICCTNTTSDSVEISHVQLYMESIQDLLAPEKINISINEDPRTGEVSLPGATICRIRDLEHFLELIQVGEANRHAANTKQNAESSRSHAILMVYVRRSVEHKIEEETGDKEMKTDMPCGNVMPKIRKSKLLIVDLAGSERVDKSGSEGHLLEEAKFINLSLTSLGKCINALAENSAHIPTRDSKLTRLLRDSFGGSARTSLIITVGPSARHHAETTSTIMFGQRAMKIVNMVKLKEEFDYESQCRKLEAQVDQRTAELEREQRVRENEKFNLEKQLNECQYSFAESEKNLVFLEGENIRLLLEMKDIMKELEHHKTQKERMLDKVAQLEMSLEHSQQQQLESLTYQKVLADTTQMYEKKIAELLKQLEDERTHRESAEEQIYVMKELLSDSQKLIKERELESSTYQKAVADSAQMYEKKIADLNKQLEDELACSKSHGEQLHLSRKLLSDHQHTIEQYEAQNSTYQKALADTTQRYEKKISELLRQLEDKHTCTEGSEENPDLEVQETGEIRRKLEEMCQLHESTNTELQTLKSDYIDLLQEKEALNRELCDMRQRLALEEKQKKSIEHELEKLKKSAPENDNDFEEKRSYMKENIGKGSSSFGTPRGLHKSNPQRETIAGQRATIAKICEEVGLQKILQLLSSDDTDVQTHAVKVIANLAAEDLNQEKIVEEGGLDALLMLLKSTQNTTILRVASGAIANLAMNEVIQGLIMSKGGAQMLANTASKTDDPQTLRMVAGALANLCGNERLHMMLKEDGGIKALLEMTSSRNTDIIAQVARGIANFAKCESRGTVQGHREGRSLLLDDGALKWLISNSNATSNSTRRHIELALCHLAQNKDNVRDFTSSGGIEELVRISVESSRDDIRNLAKKTLKMYPEFEVDLD